MATAEQLLVRIEAQTEQLRREMRRAEQAVGNSSKRMEREVRRVDQGMDRLNRTATTLRRVLGALGVGLSVQALRSFATGALTTADAIAKTADRVGVATDALQEYEFAASQSGVASNVLNSSLERLTRRIGEARVGKGELAAVAKELNLELTNTESVLDQVADAIQRAPDASERARIAFAAFGREGLVLVNMLRNGSAGVDEMRQRARDLGLVIRRDLLPHAERFNDSVDALFRTIRARMQEGFLDTFLADMEDLSDIAKDESFHTGLETIGGAIGYIGRSVTGMISDFGRFVEFLKDPSFQGLMDATSGFLRRDPVGGMVADFIDTDSVDQLMDTAQKLTEVRERLARLESEGAPGAHIKATREEAAALEEQLAAIQAQFDPINDRAADTAVNIGTIRVEADEIETTTKGTASNVAQISEHEKAILAALEAATSAREQHAEAVATTLNDLRRQVELGELEVQYLGDQSGELEVQQELYRIRNRLGEDAARKAEPYLRQLQKQTQEIDAQAEAQQRFKQVVDDTVRYGSDLFADLFRDTSGGWRNMWDNMVETMKSALVRMVAEAAMRKIVVQVLGVAGVAGAGAAAGAAGIGGGGGILGSLLGMGQQAASLADGGLFSSGIFGAEGALSGVGSFMSKPLFMVPTGAIEAGTGAMAMAPGISLGGVLGAAGLGYMGGGLIAQLTGGNQMGGSIGGAGGAALGAAIGSAIPGVGTVIGGLAGGLLGGGIGSLFGGDNNDQEIQPKSAGLSSGHFQGGAVTPFRRFQPGSARFDVSGLTRSVVQADEAIAAALSDRAVEQVQDYFNLAGRIDAERRDNKELGPQHMARFLRDTYRPVIEALGGEEASRGFKDMAGGSDPEQVLEAAQKAAIFLGTLQDGTLFKPQEISQLEQAWKTLNAQIDDAKGMAEQLGQSLAEVERQGKEARQAFYDEIDQGYQDQIDAFLRPTEHAWRQLRQAQEKELKSLEAVGASTAKAQQWHQLQIRQLFEQNYELQRQYLEGMIDLGEDLNAQVGALWGIVSSGIGQLAQDTSSAYQEAVRLGRQYSQINRSLQQTILGLQIGPQSPLSLEQQLAEAIDQFRNALGSALTGDTDAAAQLQQLVNPVLELASQFFGSTEGYAQIFDEVIRGLEMAGVAAETQAGGFAALAGALDAQLQILGEINDVLNQRDELGEDFEARYNKLTSELEGVGYTIGGINAFLQDAADAIPTLIVTAFSSGLDSAQLARRMGELFQVTVTATEQAMRDGVEDIGAAIDGAQQALLRGWIPDFIELAEQFNGAIPEIRFDRVTARVVAHYEASADQLGSGLRSAVAQVQFDGLQQAIYTAQELVGTRFDAAVGGISFERVDGTLLAMTLRDGITGVAEAAQVSLNGQAQRIEGVIDRTLEAFTLDATRATILDSVDIINNGATSVQLAFGRVEGALLRLSNNADGHITALIDEVDTAVARFVNWGQGSLRVGVESLRAGLLDVRNAGQGALELWADTVEARETRISNLGPGALAARINSLRGQLVNVRNSGTGLLEFWADTVESRATVIENIDRGNLRAVINDLRGGIVMVRNLSRGHLQFWANRVNADTVRIENIGRGDLRAIVNDLRSGIVTIRNRAAGHLEFWADRVEAGETRIENVGRGDLMAFVTTLRSGLVSVRNLGAGHLRFWANRVEAGETRIENINRGNLDATIGTLRSALVTIRNLGSGRLEFWAETIKAQEARIENLGRGTLVAFVNTLRSSLVVIHNAGQGRLEFWADVVEAQETRIENLSAGTLVARINNLRSDLLTIRNAGQGRLAFWAETVKAREKSITGINAGNIGKNANTLRSRLVTTRNTAQQRLNAWGNRVKQELNRITNLSKDLGGGSIAAELRKIVKNNLPKRFNSAINQAFKDVFGTQRGNFFGNMKNLLGDNSALVSNLRSLTLALRKQEKQALNKAISDYASRAGREAGDSLKSANVSVPTQQSSGRSQKDWERLGDVARANMSLKTGSFSHWDIPGSDRNKDWLMSYRPMLTGLAQQMQDMVGGTLPRVNLAVNTSKGVPQLRMQVGGHNWMTFSGSTLALDNVAAKFTQSLKWMLSKTISGEKDKILRSVDFSKDAVGGMRELARKLAQAGIAPGFADGGMHAGGLRIVGERGPELEYTGPSRIYSAPDTSRIMAGFANDNGNFRELIAEVRALRAENAELRRTVSEGFGDTVQAEGQSGLALRGELRALREDVEDLQASTRQQARRRAA